MLTQLSGKLQIVIFNCYERFIECLLHLMAKLRTMLDARHENVELPMRMIPMMGGIYRMSGMLESQKSENVKYSISKLFVPEKIPLIEYLIPKSPDNREWTHFSRRYTSIEHDLLAGSASKCLSL